METVNDSNNLEKEYSQNQIELNKPIRIEKRIYIAVFFLYTIILSILFKFFSVKEVMRDPLFQSIFNLSSFTGWVVIFLILSALATVEIISQSENYSLSIIKANELGTLYFGLLFVTTSSILFFSIINFASIAGSGEYYGLEAIMYLVSFVIFSLFTIPCFYFIAGKLKLLERNISVIENGKENIKYEYTALSILFLFISLFLITDFASFIFLKL